MLRALFLVLLSPLTAAAATYEVGPGKPLTTIGAVPWESLMPGDLVLIHARPTPYAEKWALNRSGVTVRGVPDASNNLPIITGLGATTRSQLAYLQQDRSIVFVGATTMPADTMATDVVFESLHFRRAREGDAFTSAGGVASTYGSNAAALYLAKGRRITVQRCIIEDFERGLVAGPDVEDLTVERNVFRGNARGGGAVGSANLDVEVIRLTARFNMFGSPVIGSEAENVRDNSAGSTYAYNFFAGGNRLLDLEGDSVHSTRPEHARIRVFGNVLLKTSVGGNNALIQFDAVNGGNRTLELWHNTFVSRRVQSRMVNGGLRPGLAVKLINCIVRGPMNGDLVLMDGEGSFQHGGNWVQTTTQPTSPASTALTVDDLGGSIDGISPGFLDETLDDFRLTSGAAPIDRAIPLPAGLDVPVLEFRHPAEAYPRGDDGKPDIGAFEQAMAPQIPDAGTMMPDGGTVPQVGLVGWKVGCSAAPGPLMLLVMLITRALRRGEGAVKRGTRSRSP